MADAAVSKTVEVKLVWVRLPPSAPQIQSKLCHYITSLLILYRIVRIVSFMVLTTITVNGVKSILKFTNFREALALCELHAEQRTYPLYTSNNVLKYEETNPKYTH